MLLDQTTCVPCHIASHTFLCSSLALLVESPHEPIPTFTSEPIVIPTEPTLTSMEPIATPASEPVTAIQSVPEVDIEHEVIADTIISDGDVNVDIQTLDTNIFDLPQKPDLIEPILEEPPTMSHVVEPKLGAPPLIHPPPPVEPALVGPPAKPTLKRGSRPKKTKRARPTRVTVAKAKRKTSPGFVLCIKIL